MRLPHSLDNVSHAGGRTGLFGSLPGANGSRLPYAPIVGRIFTTHTATTHRTLGIDDYIMDYLWTPWRYGYVSGADKGGTRVGVPDLLSAWPGDRHCVFCNLQLSSAHAAQAGMDATAADRAALIVYRGSHCFICLNAYPYSSGHVMVIPYAHEQSLAGLSEEAALQMMQLARLVETALRAVYSPHGINLGMNLGKAAGAGVDEHLHLHVLPRWLGDTNFMTVTAETRVLPETLEITWERLRDAFTKLLPIHAD